MKRLPLIAGLAGALVCQPVAAEPELKPEPRVGSRFVKDPAAVSRNLTNLMLADFAVCMVKKRRGLVAEFVTDRSTLRFGDKYQRLLDPDCLDGPALADEYELRLDESAMRYALAEALLREELSAIDPATLAAAPSLSVPVIGPLEIEAKDRKAGAIDLQKMIEAQRALDQATIIMFKFGDCAVRANPAGAQAILRAPAGSKSEGEAVQAFLPTLQACLEKGAQVSLNKVKLRGAVATSYYSLARASQAAR